MRQPTKRDDRLEQTFLDVSGALVDDFDVVEVLTLLTERCVEILDVATAVVTLVAAGGDLHVIARSTEASRPVELAELQSRHGPSWDCVHSGTAIVNQDLTALGDRWPRFAPDALDAGFHSAHAFPMRLRGSTFGALSFLRVDGGGLSTRDVVMAQALADLAIVAIVQHSAALEVGAVDRQLGDALDTRVLIDQAANVVAEHGGVDADPGFQRLRNHARANRFRLVDVAVDVVSGALPTATIAPPRPRRRASDGVGARPTLRGSTRVATTSTLAVVSHAIEAIALDSGAEATVIALFQRGPYLAPMVATYTTLVESGATVVIAYAGPGPLVPGAVHVPLGDDDALAVTWATILLTPTTGAYVVGHDMDALGPIGPTLEARRQFESSWGFDRASAAAETRTILGQLRERLPPSTADHVAEAVTLTEATPAPRTERSLANTALVLATSLDRAHQRLIAADRRADLGAPSMWRDTVTGLISRRGLDRWLGGDALADLETPAMGLIMIGLDRSGAVGDRRDRAVGDRLLHAIASALVAATRPEDVIVRWAADEFIVLCAGVAGDELTDVARRLVATVCTTTVDGMSVAASASVQVCRDRRLPISAATAAVTSAKQAVGDHVLTVGSVA